MPTISKANATTRNLCPMTSGRTSRRGDAGSLTGGRSTTWKTPARTHGTIGNCAKLPVGQPVCRVISGRAPPAIMDTGRQRQTSSDAERVRALSSIISRKNPLRGGWRDGAGEGLYCAGASS